MHGGPVNVEDRGSIGTAFAPDGTVRQAFASVRHSSENIHLTFNEVPGVMAPECPSGAR
jgi:hypothetical protein